MGTENSNVAFIQPFLRRNGTDCFAGENSFRSVSNQVKIYAKVYIRLFNLILP